MVSRELCWLVELGEETGRWQRTALRCWSILLRDASTIGVFLVSTYLLHFGAIFLAAYADLDGLVHQASRDDDAIQLAEDSLSGLGDGVGHDEAGRFKAALIET